MTSSSILAATVRAAPLAAARLAPSLAAAPSDAPVLPPVLIPPPHPSSEASGPAPVPEEAAKIVGEKTPRVSSKETDKETREKLDAMRERAKALQDEQVRQARLTFNVAIGLLIVGVLIIFSGSAVLLLQEKAGTGAFTVVAGGIAEIISVVLFGFHKQTNDKLDIFRNELSAIESARFSMTLIEKIEDPVKRDDAIRETVQKLRPP
jgi:hypothetical protein